MLLSCSHSSLCFILKVGRRTHIHMLIGWTSLTIWRKVHMCIFIFKAIRGKPPVYLCKMLSPVSESSDQTRSSRRFIFSAQNLVKLHFCTVHLGLKWNSICTFLRSCLNCYLWSLYINYICDVYETIWYLTCAAILARYVL